MCVKARDMLAWKRVLFCKALNFCIFALERDSEPRPEPSSYMIQIHYPNIVPAASFIFREFAACRPHGVLHGMCRSFCAFGIFICASPSLLGDFVCGQRRPSESEIPTGMWMSEADTLTVPISDLFIYTCLLPKTWLGQATERPIFVRSLSGQLLSLKRFHDISPYYNRTTIFRITKAQYYNQTAPQY